MGAAVANRKRKGTGKSTSRNVKRRVGRRIPALRSASRPASQVLTRRKQKGTSAPSHEWTTVSQKMGRYKRPTVRTIDRYLKRMAEPTIYKWNGASAFDNRGLYGIGRCDDAASSPVNHLLPLYVCDLTGIRNIVNGSEAGAQCLYRMAMPIGTTGAVTWVGQTNLGATGNSTTAIQFESTGSTATSINTPHQTSLLKWLDVRLNLWGTTNKPTRFIVQLVKLYDMDLDPFVTSANTGYTNQFWQSLVKQYAYNPISTIRFPAGTKRKMRVLKTYTVNFDPQSTTDNDQDPKCQTLKWFLKRDEIIDYRNRGNAMNLNDLIADEDYTLNQAQCNAQPKTSGKIFLLVRAAAYTAATGGTTDTDNTVTPSFDLVFRSCHITGSA